MKKILSLFFLLLFFFLVKPLAYANDKFSTYYNVSYNISSNLTTKVTLDIELKNDSSDYYAASYNVQTGFKKIKNIKVSDSGGDVKASTKENDKGVEVSFGFNKNVVGINNSQRFKVVFETDEVAKNDGSIWEVNIPGVLNQSEFQEFNTKVIVPESFGNPTIIKPLAKDYKISKNIISFSKEDLANSGISISYGTSQVYNFDLTYHLQNKKLFPIWTEIAVPSNNNYQNIKISDINPIPINVTIDKDGNWMASYKLIPSQSINVKVKGTANVSYEPKKEILTNEQKKLYLLPQPYWESSNPKIQELAKELKTPEKIYRYVVENLKYDTNRIQDTQIRAGAAGVLRNKNSSVCLEFTDLFIALSRASGIPARAVEGFANTNNSAQRPLSLFKDILHSWPEYYDFDKEAWIMVDPTWENTTNGMDYFHVFDFDHFAFVIKGVTSDYPVPAGGYKIPGKESTKDVEIKTFKNFDTNVPVLTTKSIFAEKFMAGFPVDGKIEVYNLSGVLSPGQVFKVSSENLTPTSQDLYFSNIPPYGKKVIQVKFYTNSFLTNQKDTIKIRIGKETFEEKVIVFPFYKSPYFILGGFIVGSIIIIISAIIRKSRRLHVSG